MPTAFDSDSDSDSDSEAEAEAEIAERHVRSLRGTPQPRWATRDRILLEASRLFATHGFRGASTRQIAERVGIAQPSLFKHFPSKRAILAELAIYDMDVPARHAEQVACAAGSAVDRFAGYVAWDLEWYRTMPFDLRGMTEDLLRSEDLPDAQAALSRWHRAIDQILQQGVDAGEVAASAVPFLPTVIETLSWHMVHAADASEASVDDAVELVIAAALASSRDVGH